MNRIAVMAFGALLAVALFLAIFRSTGSREDDPDPTAGTARPGATHGPGSAPGSAPGAAPSKVSRNSAIRGKAPLGLSGWGTIEDWTQTGETRTWSQKDDVLVSGKEGGSIGREVTLPPQARIGLDLSWDDALRFRVLLRSSDGESTQPDNAYDLVFHRNILYLRKRFVSNSGDGNRTIGRADIGHLSKAGKARFEIYIDQEDGRFGINVNGKPLPLKMHQPGGQQAEEGWRDISPEKGDFGDWLQFVSDDSFPVEISDISVGSWDGFLPKAEPATPPTEP